MYALKTHFATAVLIGLLLAGSQLVSGQKLPSQRYQPTREQAMRSPPSVHVPPQQARQLSQSGYPRPAFEGKSGTTYNFTDAPQNPPAADINRGRFMQTSYQEPSQGEPAVPAILSGKSSAADQGPSTLPNRTPLDSSTPFHKNAKSPAEFASQMQHLRSGTPRLAPGEFQDSQSVKQEIAAFQQKAISQQQSRQAQTAVFEKPTETASTQSTPEVTTTSFMPATEAPQKPEVAEQTDTGAIQLKSTANPTQEVSASDFIANAASPTSKSQSANRDTSVSDTPTLVAQRVKETPARTRINATESLSTPDVQAVSMETEVPQASIALSSPAIEVETFGPQSVGIDKPATYKVVVTNNSSQAAERILVGIDLPAWVDLENVNLTTGGKEVGNSPDQARLVWSVDRVAGNTSETISITAVPRKAEVFDLNIEWTLVPRTGAANIQVTQPKLEMNIVGPDEVLYGEQALYHVTVRNPGTGTAETSL
jgi:hypothetical protein